MNRKTGYYYRPKTGFYFYCAEKDQFILLEKCGRILPCVTDYKWTDINSEWEYVCDSLQELIVIVDHVKNRTELNPEFVKYIKENF